MLLLTILLFKITSPNANFMFVTSVAILVSPNRYLLDFGSIAGDHSAHR